MRVHEVRLPTELAGYELLWLHAGGAPGLTKQEALAAQVEYYR